jgi:hypothetical protein
MAGSNGRSGSDLHKDACPGSGHGTGPDNVHSVAYSNNVEYYTI